MRLSQLTERLMLDLLMARYDVLMHSGVFARLYDGSDFFNLGYWRPETRSPREAAENLLDEMLALVPANAAHVLDVACGMGATTRRLGHVLPAAHVTGVNLSARQLERCRINAPASHFVRSDATMLPFRDASMDLVVCVEAIPHFHDRPAFLAETHRVLAPSGWLVLSDVLFSSTWRHLSRAGNGNWKGPYEAAYRDAGFEEVQIVDVTRATWEPFDRYAATWAREQRRTRAIGVVDFARVMAGPVIARLTLRKYLLVAARRR